MASLAPGASQSFTFTYDVTQTDINNNGAVDGTADGNIHNTATVTDDQNITQQASTDVTVVQSSDLALAKTANIASVSSPSDDITYTITVTNNSNQTLTNVVVTDPMDPTVGHVVGTVASLAPGASQSFTFTYDVTQADINNNGAVDGTADGIIHNTATVTDDQNITQHASTNVAVVQSPDLTITKTVASVTGGTADKAGDVIDYTITVHNTGNVDLTGVTVSDKVESNGATSASYVSGDTNSDGAINPGETWTYDAKYTLTQADLNNKGGGDGKIDNTATVTDSQHITKSASASENLFFVPTETGTASLTVNEAALDTTKAGLDLAAGLVTGSSPLLTTESAQSNGLTFTAGSDNISGTAFGSIGGITVTGAAVGATFTWVVNGAGQLEGHIGNSGGPIGIILAIGGTTTASAGGTASPTITATLTDNFPHAAGSGSISVTGIQVVAHDTVGNTANGSVSVNILDDVPSAANHSATVQEGSSVGTVDVAFIVDISGSMGSSGGGGVGFDVPGFSDDRIGLARYSMQQLLTNHPEILNVQITRFSDTANTQVWMSRADALTFINANGNWSAGGTTNYDAALNSEMTAYNASSRPLGQADQTVVYFLSDGAPNQPASDPGITNNGAGSDVSIAEWETFATAPANDISQVFAIGLGSGVNAANLAPISYPNTDAAAPIGTEDNIILINNSNLSTLTQTFDNLLTSVVSSSGNIFLLDGGLTTSFGADGGHILSIAINGTTYTWNGLTGASSVITETGAINGTINGAISVTAATGLGGQLTFYFVAGSGHNAGDWAYTSPANVAADTHDLFPYAIIDNDGDTSSATLDITVTNVNEAPTITSNGGGATASLNVNENTTAVTTVTSTDPDGPSAIYSIVGGSDAAKFTINTSSGALTFAAAPNFETPTDSDANNSYIVQVQVSDGALHDTQTITVNVTNVNEAPVATITPLSYSATEQTNLTLQGTGLSISDVDAGAGSMTVTLSVGEGILTLAAGNSGATVSNSGTSSVTITGTVAQINNLLGGIDTGPGSAGTITYNDNTDTPSASTTLTLLVHDNGNTGGGDLVASDTATINITAVNDAPNANDDTVITNISGSGAAIAILDAALLFNDTDPEGHALTISSSGFPNGSSGSASHAGTTTTFTDNNTNGGSFSYSAQDGGSPNLTDTASVTVNRTQAGESQLDGTSSNEILLGRAGTADTLIGGGGSDVLIGDTGADHFRYTSTSDGGSIANQSGADHILDFSTAQGDVIEISKAAFSGLPGVGVNASGIFSSSANDTFGSVSERFHFNTATHTLLYDSNGSGSGGTQVALAVLENGGAVDATHILMVA